MSGDRRKKTPKLRVEDREIAFVGRIKRLLLALVAAVPAGVALALTANAAWREVLTAWFPK